MENKQIVASKKEAAAIVLPEKKASEPFEIPWEEWGEMRKQLNEERF